ncbi:hypothetical protein SSPNP10_28345 [Streptomyces sp. NP10]|uniref:hypothetical protein n=1 Tax=Streptomyces sp. NP10 TaxID=1141731 RepID=UPI001000BCDF|nr:hypothetical protein [Streptomyces sp. NP10]RUP64632.1 hypothetical protein SSPNP10_28345 [Streptomyces sp. NP10]
MRSASGAWAVVSDLVAQSSVLSRDEAVQAISATEAVGRMLIAAGHLRQHSITLVAGKVHCEITTAVAQACPVSTGERRSTWSATASPMVEPITGFEAPETTNYR